MATAMARVGDGRCGDELCRIIRSEFAEMPGMRLNQAQFCRLWNLGSVEGASVARKLVGDGYLVIDGRGQYCRRVDADP